MDIFLICIEEEELSGLRLNLGSLEKSRGGVAETAVAETLAADGRCRFERW
jgi:hypothetical protein